MRMYYDFSEIDGYKAPVRMVISKRGLGKTFGAVKKALKAFVKHQKRFIYVVENLEQVKTLSQNKGEKFFSAIFKALSNSTSKTSRQLCDALTQSGESEVTEGDTLNSIKGGTIRICGDTAGYIVALSDFSNLKRNNFIDVKYIICDEFIPEEVTARNINTSRKLISVIQSIARTNDIIIYMFANSVRLNDNLLVKLGLHNIKPGEFRQIKDQYGILMVCHYVDNSEYAAFTEISDKSVAGRLAKLLNEDNLDNNEFKDKLSNDLRIPTPAKESHLFACLHGENISVRINVTKDYSEYYVFNDYGKNKRSRYCVDVRYSAPAVMFEPHLKDFLIEKFRCGSIKFDTAVEYNLFKLILKLNTKIS